MRAAPLFDRHGLHGLPSSNRCSAADVASGQARAEPESRATQSRATLRGKPPVEALAGKTVADVAAWQYYQCHRFALEDFRTGRSAL